MMRALVDELIAEASPELIEEWIAESSVVELAALEHCWPFWARPNQLPPSGKWRSWGFLAGRGFGKTLSVSKFINEEVRAGRAKMILLCAQDEQSAVDLQINGPSGLIATAKPDCMPTFKVGELCLEWPNGARAYVRSPHEPGKIRGLEYDLGWLCEIQSWPLTTRGEAWKTALTSIRTGYARLVWDCTPKRAHPILKQLLARAEDDPRKHVVVRGTTYENAANLAEGYVQDLESTYANTREGREEMHGEMGDDIEGATLPAEAIEQHRAPLPARLARRAIGLDPAVSNRKGSDDTGIVDCGVDAHGHGYVIADYTSKYAAHAWAALVVDLYLSGRCDCVVAETNKGGDLVSQNLRSEAATRGLAVVVLTKEAKVPPHNPRVIYVREIYARGDKRERAKPVATAYERGRVSHVIGADLTSLETTLTTWEPAPNADSPGDLDALVHALTELLSLNRDVRNNGTEIRSAAEAQRTLSQPRQQSHSIASLMMPIGRRGL